MPINRRANGRRALPEVDSGSCNDRRSLPRRPGLGSHSSALSAKLVTAPVLEAVAAFTGHPVRSVPAGPAPRKGERGGGGHGAVGQTQLFTIHFDTRLAQYTVHDRGPRPVPLSGPPAWQSRPAGSLPVLCRCPAGFLLMACRRARRDLPGSRVIAARLSRAHPVRGRTCSRLDRFGVRSVPGQSRSRASQVPGRTCHSLIPYPGDRCSARPCSRPGRSAGPVPPAGPAASTANLSSSSRAEVSTAPGHTLEVPHHVRSLRPHPGVQ